MGKPGRKQRAAPPPRRLGPARKAAWDHGLDLCAHRHAEHGRGAVGRDADDEWRAVDDRPEGEVTERWLIDDVDRYAVGTGRGGEFFRIAVVLARADRDRGASEVVSRDG